MTSAPRLFTPAFGALFAAALVFFTSGGVVQPVAEAPGTLPG
jgi:hypothetical protein